MAYVCPNPECNNTKDFEAAAVMYITQYYTASGDCLDYKYYDSDTTGKIKCSWCNTPAEKRDDEEDL